MKIPDMDMREEERAEARRRKILAVRGTKEGLRFIINCLRDHHWRVRKTALESLLESYSPELYIRDLIDMLYEQDNAGARNAAIEALVSVGKKAIPYLKRAFNTTDHDVKKFIVDILGTIGDPEAIPILLQAAEDEDDNVRASAIEYLGRMKEDSVIEALIKKVKTGDTWIAYPAIEALGRLQDPRAVPVLLEALSDRSLSEPVIRALSMIGVPESLEDIVPYMKDRRRSIQQEVIKAIARFYDKGVSIKYIHDVITRHLGEEATEVIARLVEERDKETKAAAALVQAILKDRRAIRHLLDLASEDRFREMAIDTLQWIATEFPDRILHYLRAGFPETRRIAAEVIASLKDRRFYEPLMDALNDTDGHVIGIAARGLSFIGDRKTAEAIQPLLGHPYPDVQDAAVDALYNLRDYLDMYRLKDLLKDDNERVRKNVALLIGRCGRIEFVDQLALLLADPSTDVRKAAVSAIGMLRVSKAEEILKTALTDEAAEVRAFATERLASAGTATALEAIMFMTKDPDPYVRAASARALGRFPDRRALDALIGLLQDDNGYVVTQAIESLTRTGHPRAKEALIELLQQTVQREIKRTIILALASFVDTEEVIKPFLLSEDWALRYAAVKALKEIGTESAIKTLRYVRDTENDPTVLDALKEALGDT